MVNKQWYLIENKREYDLAMERYYVVKYASKGSIAHKEKLLLALLISTYEKRNLTLPDVDPIEMIKIRMEDLNLKPVDLCNVYGRNGNVSNALNYKRHLSKRMVYYFSELLHIPAECLLKPYELKSTK